MCDTMIAPPKTTAGGYGIFAKNSDRDTNEPQYFTYIPASDHAPGARVRCTYIEIGQAAHTNALILSKPSWIWGGEMGVNEFGVIIGNEAIWTRMPYGDKALIGMDSLRIALERGNSAAAAANVIIDLLEQYGQGGNCSFEGEFHYHNSYLIADARDSFVLETAGPYWALERVGGLRTISNVMSVSKYERIHPEAIAYAVSHGWCENERDFDFSLAYLDQFRRTGLGATFRAHCTGRVLRSDEGRVDVETMKRALRSHNGNNPWTASASSAPCMHAREPGDSQSTASLIAVLPPRGPAALWGTGMSTPCIAPFKPFWFDAFSDRLVFPYDRQEEAMESWLLREGLNRAFLDGRIDDRAYHGELAALEGSWAVRAAELEGRPAPERRTFCEQVCDEERAFVDRWLAKAKATPAAPLGDKDFQQLWAGWNEALGRDRRIAY